MLRRFGIAFAAIGIFGCIALMFMEWSSSSSGSGGAPVARLGTVRQVYLGLVQPGKSFEYTLALKNDLATELLLEGYNVTCGCVKIKHMPAKIAAQDYGALTFSVDPSSTPGKTTQKIYIITNSTDTKKNRFEIAVSATTEGLWPEAKWISLGKIDPKQFTAAKFLVSSLGGHDRKVEKVECSNTNLQAKYVSKSTKILTIKDDAGDYSELQTDYLFNISLEGEPRWGRLNGDILITLSSSDGPEEIRVAVDADIPGAIDTKPAQLLWTNAMAGSVVMGELEVVGLNELGASMADLSFVCDPAVKVTTKESNKLVVEWKTPLQTGQVAIKTDVEFHYKNEKVFSLPLRAFSKSGSR